MSGKAIRVLKRYTSGKTIMNNLIVTVSRNKSSFLKVRNDLFTFNYQYDYQDSINFSDFTRDLLV